MKESQEYLRNGYTQESLGSSEQHLCCDDISSHDSIEDSTHIFDELSVFDGDHTSGSMDTEGSVATNSNVFPCKCHGWRAQKSCRTKPEAENNDDCMNPLLNTNAIHERKSLNTLNIRGDSSSDEQEKDANSLRQEEIH